MSLRSSWIRTRHVVLDRCEGMCGRCGATIPAAARFDVIAFHGAIVAMHPSCRLRADAKTRCAKGVATRRARRAQLRFDFVPGRAA